MFDTKKSSFITIFPKTEAREAETCQIKEPVLTCPLIPPHEGGRGIYKITNTVTSRVYVGSTVRTFRVRWNEHRENLAEGKHFNYKLQNDYNKYGKEVFSWEIVECYGGWVDLILLQRREAYLLNQEFKSRLYNINMMKREWDANNHLYTVLRGRRVTRERSGLRPLKVKITSQRKRLR